MRQNYGRSLKFFSGGIRIKGIVAYDNVHGSSVAVAEAIAGQFRSEGNKAWSLSVMEPMKGALAVDFLFFGSPSPGAG
jgi:hypothetical protein